MESGIYIVGFDGPEFSALDPETLAAAAPVWKQDVSRYSPWGKEEFDRFPFWRAEGYDGPSTVFITGRSTSTMDVARELIAKGWMAPWGSVLAVEQSAGRGRKEREWVSPPGNVHGTWYLPRLDTAEGISSKWMNLASLLAGVAVASGLDEAGVPVRIKWPNDLIVNNRKLCGILVEDRGGRLVAGIGINVVSAPRDRQLRDDFVIPATCLNAMKQGITPLELWTGLMASGRKKIKNLTETLTTDEFIALLESRMAWIGRTVLVKQESASVDRATIVGIAEDGGLKIRREGRIEVLYTGSLVPVD